MASIPSPECPKRFAASKNSTCWSCGRIKALGGTDRDIFENHLRPWIGRFFADLERAESATFYRHVGSLGRMFMEIETEAFSLS
jgi:hypothetical protein